MLKTLGRSLNEQDHFIKGHILMSFYCIFSVLWCNSTLPFVSYFWMRCSLNTYICICGTMWEPELEHVNIVSGINQARPDAYFLFNNAIINLDDSWCLKWAEARIYSSRMDARTHHITSITTNCAQSCVLRDIHNFVISVCYAIFVVQLWQYKVK